jgi:hypothetical protein
MEMPSLGSRIVYVWHHPDPLSVAVHKLHQVLIDQPTTVKVPVPSLSIEFVAPRSNFAPDGRRTGGCPAA